MSESPVDRDLPETAAIDELPPIPAPRRHPAELTRDRLIEHRINYADHLTPADVAAMVRAEAALRAIPGRVAADRAEAAE